MKGFVFDLDGVLTDTAMYHFLAWRQLAAELGITLDEAFNEQLKGISRHDSLIRILQQGDRLADFSDTEIHQLAEKKNRYYLEQIQRLTPADVLPGVTDFLSEAKKYQLPCVVASASYNAPFILKKLAIFDWFAGIVDPATLKKGKPDPEIFIKAAAMIPAAPADIVGFEDAQAGIDGIKACGMYAIGISATDSLKNTDRTVKNLSEVKVTDWLEKEK